MPEPTLAPGLCLPDSTSRCEHFCKHFPMQRNFIDNIGSKYILPGVSKLLKTTKLYKLFIDLRMIDA